MVSSRSSTRLCATPWGTRTSINWSGNKLLGHFHHRDFLQETMRENMPEMIKFTYELKCFRDGLEIKEFYPEKNPYESKAKKDYGNKAYKDGKDLDALYHYSQVSRC